LDAEKIENLQKKLETATWKRWFPLLFVLIQFIPSYTSKGYDPRKMGEVIGIILQNAVISSLETLYPLFKIIPIILVALIVLKIRGVTRWFNIYAGVSYVLFAFLQSTATTNEYGFSIVTSNLIMFIIVAASWFWDVLAQKNDLTKVEQSTWRYWVIPLAFAAFWYPLNRETFMPDFNPMYLLTNVSGLTFCMMTPVYLAILTLYYPKINTVTLRVTGLAGIIIASYNILLNFIMYPEIFWWNGVLHIPLLIISGYSLGIKKRTS
jgi:hypothetical protein